MGGLAAETVNDLVRSRLRAAGEDPAAVGEVEDDPEGAEARERLTAVLTGILETDPDFRASLAGLVAAATRSPALPPPPQNTGSIVIGDGARVRGNVALRDVVINRIHRTDNSTLVVLAIALVAALAALVYGGTRIVTGGPDSSAGPKVVWEDRAETVGTPVGESGHVAVFAQDKAVVGRDLRDGKVLWTVRDGDNSLPGHAVDHSGTVIVHFEGGEVRALHTDTGRTIWSHQIPRDSEVTTGDGSLQLVDRTVYVTAFDHVEALNVDTGTALWSTRLEGAVLGGLQHAKGTLLVRGLSSDTVYYALDPGTGSVRWTKRTDRTTSPMLAADTVVLSLRDNTISALAATDGSEKWHIQGSLRDMFVHDTTAVLMGDTTRAYALLDGKERWSLPVSKKSTFQKTVVDGVLVIQATGEVIAVDMRSGRIAWRQEATLHDAALGSVLVNRDDAIHALDPGSGAEQWSMPDPTAGSDEMIGGHTAGFGRHLYLWTFNAKSTSPSMDRKGLLVIETPVSRG
ncbi:PQQ-binding-like beta-propeller repeat protein [Streptomyces sp. NPDC041003]|uniref:PQQ-binding-like beta-propeller repeat protein n=1 Tax=Streptomyces sp. NPDC041003 TaxID=3155730 RepID=UPI0033F088C6